MSSSFNCVWPKLPSLSSRLLVSVGPPCDSCLPTTRRKPGTCHTHQPQVAGDQQARPFGAVLEVRTHAIAVAARAGRAKEAKLNSIFGLPPKLHEPTPPRRALGCHHQQLPSAAIVTTPSLNRQHNEQTK